MGTQEVAPAGQPIGAGVVQAVAELVQRVMWAQDGSCLQMRCDEKGFLAVCAFGLQGQTHEDAPARALLAALSIVKALKVTCGI